MNRKKMDYDTGMLFVYSQNEYRRFWMKDTYIALSIAFISKKGVIEEIKAMYPLSEDPVWSSKPVRYALEMNQGWFEENNISSGDKVFFPKEFDQLKNR